MTKSRLGRDRYSRMLYTMLIFCVIYTLECVNISPVNGSSFELDNFGTTSRFGYMSDHVIRPSSAFFLMNDAVASCDVFF